MLVDQYYVRGVQVTFFGRRTHGQPAAGAARPAISTARSMAPALSACRTTAFRAELTDEIEPVRDADGKIDIAGTMQIITSVIEGWIREHPEQWLWLHRRWRPEEPQTA